MRLLNHVGLTNTSLASLRRIQPKEKSARCPFTISPIDDANTILPHLGPAVMDAQ